jgi:hypothetical protein
MLHNVQLWRQVTQKKSNNYLIGGASKIQQNLTWSAKDE